ncbi:MAG: TrpB-like pyridoxal-phosphate dependent enzyme, partial [Candidatus Thermoplasmatota archaeon]|nr:TrpB-like pyridoxal-phosphate dependent enzyme [Candidatus Thermoplasmatota archaeon]
MAEIVNLTSEELPKSWYNILPDLPDKLPKPKNPPDKNSIELLPKMMIKECLRQEHSETKFIKIPDEVLELYEQAGRPRPLIRAIRLEQKLRTKCKLYYKAEFYSPTGSHKVNTALAQAYY